MKPVKLGPFLGMNNRRPRNQLGIKEGAFLADAVNVDFMAGGQLHTRAGCVQVLAMDRTHSMWQNYFVAGDTLYRMAGAATAPTTNAVLAGLAPSVRMSYTEHGDGLYCTNGQNVWRIDGSTGVEAGIAPPFNEPLIIDAAGGALPRGYYQFSVAHVDVTGAVSGASAPVQFLVTVGGVTLLNIPQRAGYTTRIYMSSTNGTELYRHSDVTSGTQDIRTLSEQGESIYSMHKTRIPAGGIIRSHKGRLLVASGSLLYYTDPWSMYHNPATDFIPLPGDISIVEPCDGGVYVVADKTYWLGGDVAGAETILSERLPYGACFGTSGQLGDNKGAFWMSTRGLVVGAPDGTAKNVQEENIAVTPARYGATMFREEDGSKQLVSSTYHPTQTVTATKTFMDAEVINQTAIL